MKATKKQIQEVTIEANNAGFSVEKALHTLSNCSLAMYKILGAKEIVESSIRANSDDFVDTLEQTKKSQAVYISKNRNKFNNTYFNN